MPNFDVLPTAKTDVLPFAPTTSNDWNPGGDDQAFSRALDQALPENSSPNPRLRNSTNTTTRAPEIANDPKRIGSATVDAASATDTATDTASPTVAVDSRDEKNNDRTAVNSSLESVLAAFVPEPFAPPLPVLFSLPLLSGEPAPAPATELLAASAITSTTNPTPSAATALSPISMPAVNANSENPKALATLAAAPLTGEWFPPKNFPVPMPLPTPTTPVPSETPAANTLLTETSVPQPLHSPAPDSLQSTSANITKTDLAAALPLVTAQKDLETKVATLTKEMAESLVTVMDPAAETQAARENLSAAPPVRGATESAGTGIASTAASMKKTENVNKVAGLDAQFLPSATSDAARDAALPTRGLTHATATSPAPEKAETNFHFALPTMAAPTGDVSRTVENFILPTLNEAGLRTVERTHEMVSVHALRLIESQADSLQVVIKPGGGTELSLELRHRNGTLEAAAVLQSGDYQLLNQHWPELQQKLEQRGIKLAPLGNEAGFGTPDQGNFSRRQPSPEQSAQQASAFAEFTVAAKRGGATARMAPVAMANEWWA